jgi:hypothetical protein
MNFAFDLNTKPKVIHCNLKWNQKNLNLEQNKNFAIYKKLLCTFVYVVFLFEILFFFWERRVIAILGME